MDGSETMVAQDPPDRRGRDPDPELSQLTLDAHTSPAPVLPTETNDELDELVAASAVGQALVVLATVATCAGRVPGASGAGCRG